MISWGPASEQKCMHVANHIVYNMYSCGNFYSRDHGRCQCVKRHVKSNELQYSSQHEAQLGLGTGRAFGRLRCPAAHTWSQGGGFSGNSPWPRNWYASREPTQGGSGLAGIIDVTVRWLLGANQLTTVPPDAPPAQPYIGYVMGSGPVIDERASLFPQLELRGSQDEVPR